MLKSTINYPIKIIVNTAGIFQKHPSLIKSALDFGPYMFLHAPVGQPDKKCPYTN